MVTNVTTNMAAAPHQTWPSRDSKGELKSDHPGISRALLGGSCRILLTLNPTAVPTETVYLSWQNTSSVHQLEDLSKTTDPKQTIKSGLGQTVTANVWLSHLEKGRKELWESGLFTQCPLLPWPCPKWEGWAFELEMISLRSSAPSQSRIRVLWAEPLSSSLTLGVQGAVAATPLPLAKLPIMKKKKKNAYHVSLDMCSVSLLLHTKLPQPYVV